MRTWLVWVAGVAVVVGCGPTEEAGTEPVEDRACEVDLDTGVSGHVDVYRCDIGDDDSCVEPGAGIRIVVYEDRDGSGRVDPEMKITETTADDEGDFTIDLDLDDYIVCGDNGENDDDSTACRAVRITLDEPLHWAHLELGGEGDSLSVGPCPLRGSGIE